MTARPSLGPMTSNKAFVCTLNVYFFPNKSKSGLHWLVAPPTVPAVMFQSYKVKQSNANGAELFNFSMLFLYHSGQQL